MSGMEIHTSGIEKTKMSLKEKQAQNMEKAFQGGSFNEGTKPRHINTINEGKCGERVNGILYRKKEFTMDGERVEGVFPVFTSEHNVRMPEKLYKASDHEQMKYCTKDLAKKIERKPGLAKKFTPRQLEQIRNGEPRISGLTWHHNESPGLMQLVHEKDHMAAPHTGGRSLWGGGRR